MRCRIPDILLLLLTTLPPGYACQEDTTKVYQLRDVNIYADRQMRMTHCSEIMARMPLQLQETPASISVVTQQRFKDQYSASLSDALESISGVNIQGSLGTHDYFLIRGFESTTSGLIVTDGVREPNISLFRFYGFGFHDLYNVAQVEVWKGPSGFLYGGNTPSGTVNLAPKRPMFKRFAESSLTHSSYGSYRETIDIGLISADTSRAIRINGVWQKAGQFRENGSDLHYALNPTLLWDLDHKGSITASLEYLKGEIRPDLGIPLYVPEESWQLPDVPRTTSYQTPFDRVRYDAVHGKLEYERGIGRKILLRDKFYFGSLWGDSRFTLAHIPLRTGSGYWNVDRHMYCFTETQPYLGNQLEVTASFRTGPIRHQLLGGLECAYYRDNSLEWTTMLKPVGLFDPRDAVTGFDQLLSSRIRSKTLTKTLTIAPYLIDYISFSSKMQVFCGTRSDYVDFFTSRRQEPFDYVGRALTSKPVPFARTGYSFSPMAGIILKDSEKLWFYFNTGRAFSQSARMVDDYEESSQYEAGFKYAPLNRQVTILASFYRLLKENMSIPLKGPLQGGLYTSTGSQQSLGLEFEMNARTRSDEFLFFSYSFIEAELITFKALTASQYGKLVLKDFSGNKPVFVPAHILNGWITKLFRFGLGFGFGVRYVSDQYVNLENTLITRGYPLWDAMVQYKMRHYRMQLKVDNLADKKYLIRGLGSYSVIPGGCMMVHGTMEMEF